MTCPRCRSVSVRIENEVTTKIKHRGCLAWILWIILACCTLGLIIIIPLITNSKIKTKKRTVCICQDCGKKWYI